MAFPSLLLFVAAASFGAAVSPDDIERGGELARRYCVGCHLFPNPDLLDRATWKNGTLPFLRARLGIDRLDPTDAGQRLVLDEWDLVWKYYLAVAPEKSIENTATAKAQPHLKQFTVVNPLYRPGKRFVTLTQIDPQSHRIYVGNAQTKTLDVLDQNGSMLSSLSVDSPPVGLVSLQNAWFCTMIGRVPPHNEALGKLVQLEKTGDVFSRRTDILTDLPRPTDSAIADLNGDGREDFVVSGFGNIIGSLTWYERTPEGGFAPHVLYDRPGAVRTEIVDLNRDGRPDIVVMMAQAREGVYAWINKGGGDFVEMPLIEQHPVWGYSGFQLIDFDRDGDLDLLTTNGDNGEYPSCLKNYHGIRLYLNDGGNRFRQEFFFPLNGAFKAIAADFDQDDDLDIAAISYFADYERAPEESFVFLENGGSLRFQPFSFPEAGLGRWLVMDAGDVDEDGDLDIVIGSANRTPYRVPPELYAKWLSEGPTLLLLKNNLRSPIEVAERDSKSTQSKR